MVSDHPPLGHSHPWNDPLLPGDPLRPRPDWALSGFGPMPPPRPDDFPFTEAGRAAYYCAVEQAAMQGQMLMQQQMAYATMHRQQPAAPLAAESQTAFQRGAHLLLLL